MHTQISRYSHQTFQTHMTQKRSQPTKHDKTQKKKKKKPISHKLTYLLKIVPVELISDFDRSKVSDSQKREWDSDSEEDAVRAGTSTCHHR